MAQASAPRRFQARERPAESAGRHRIESPHVPVRQALRRFGETIRRMEEAASGS